MPPAKPAPAVRLPAVPEPLPCPCCGEAGEFREVTKRRKFAGFLGLYVGHASADSVGVQCYTCGLRVERGLPGKWPPGVFLEGRHYRVNLGRLKRWALARAVAAWNRRVG